MQKHSTLCEVPKCSRVLCVGGLEGDRTLGLCVANAALSQLSYKPFSFSLLYHSLQLQSIKKVQNLQFIHTFNIVFLVYKSSHIWYNECKSIHSVCRKSPYTNEWDSKGTVFLWQSPEAAPLVGCGAKPHK